MDDVGIEYQTVLGCPPVEFVHLAADLGCRAISMKASTGSYIPYNPYGYDDFSFLDDAGARRQMAGVEAPMRTRAAQGVSARECARLAVEGARGVLAEVRAEREKRG